MKSKFLIDHYLNKLINKQDLSIVESKVLMEEILIGKLIPSQIAALLTALRMKGESVLEILGFIKIMRRQMVKVQTEGIAIDTCGTGGDLANTFNISTCTALVCAASGVQVAKHGNRAASSLCGSADVLEELGVRINLPAEKAKSILEQTNFTFLFAPFYHPGMKYVAQVRKELKIKTVFNILGPFVNPAGVKRQIIGVTDLKTAEKLAKVALHLSYEHLLIVTSYDSLDEISISAKTYVFEIKKNTVKRKIISPEDFGIQQVQKEEYQGGTKELNAVIIRKILLGEKGPRRDVVVLNSAFALYVGGKAKDTHEGMKIAEKSIDSGRAIKVLEKVISYDNIT